MSSTELVDTNINRFGSAQQADCVPDTEQVFVLSSKELLGIISKAVQDATEPLYQEIAYDRQRLAFLEGKTTPGHKERQETLVYLVRGAPFGKIARSEARKKMNLSESQFSQLLKSLKDTLEVNRIKGKRGRVGRNRVICLRKQ